MKKIWIISVAAVLALSLSACGVGDVGSVSSKPASSATSSQAASSSAPKVEDSSVDNNLSGLQKYLEGDASVTGTAEKMRADLIGAVNGVRYKYGYNGNNNVSLELYEFDSSNLNAAAQKVISSVKSTGKFTLLDQQVDAVLSDNGKYLMIYKNSSNDSNNQAYTAQIKKLFTEFKK